MNTQIKMSDAWILGEWELYFWHVKKAEKRILEKGWKVAMHIKDYDLWLKEALKLADKCDWLE